MGIPIQYYTRDGYMFASVRLPNGQTFFSKVEMAPVVGAVCDHVGASDTQRLALYDMVGGGTDIVGAMLEPDEVSGRGRRRKRRKARRKRILGKVKKGLKKVGQGVVKAGKKIAKSKLVKGLAKVVKKIPVYGQIISAAAKGVKKIGKLGKRIATKVRKRRGSFSTLPAAEKNKVVAKARSGLKLGANNKIRVSPPRALPAPQTRSSQNGTRYHVRLRDGRTATVFL